MANVIKLKRSNTAGVVPTTANLADGEVAINTVDKKIYARAGASIIEVANGDAAAALANYAALRAYTGGKTLAQLTGDGISGGFVYQPSDTTSTDNGGTLIVGADGRRWKRIFSGPYMASWFGVVGGGTTDDTTTLQNVLNVVGAIPGASLLLDNPAGYKISAQITQPYSLKVVGTNNLIRCETVPTGRAAWVLEYSSWTGQHDRFYMREPLTSVILRGHANADDGVWTAGLHGIEMRSYHMTLNNVFCVGFDHAYQIAKSVTANAWLTWVIKLVRCGAFYNAYGAYFDANGANGLAGAGICLQNTILGHNTFSIYNNLCEVTLIDSASDAPITGHVSDNKTLLSGNEIGFMRWQNSRIEAGGAAGTPWITNNGVMSFDECFFTERNGTDKIFDTGANGVTNINGGLWRTSDGRYKASGAGMITQRNVQPINGGFGVLLNAINSRVLNNDFLVNTGGYAAASGDAVLSIIFDAGFLFTGNSLRITNTTASVVESAPVEFDAAGGAMNFTFRAKNASSSSITVTLKQFSRSGALISSPSVTVPNGTSTITPYSIKTQRQPNACYGIISISVPAGISAAPLLSDFYLSTY